VVGARGRGPPVQAAQPAVLATNRLRCAHGPLMEWYANRLIAFSYDGLVGCLQTPAGDLSHGRRSE
jgi:hypothetical protein